MSRIGKKPVPLPAGVTAKVDAGMVAAKGPKGELKLKFHPNMKVTVDESARQVLVGRPDDASENRALHGLTRALINNMVNGVVTPFEKKLEIIGVGYQAALAGKTLNLTVGFANVIKLPIPPGVTCTLPDSTHITLTSCDRQAVGQFAAVIHKVRPPEPYKGKGIRYEGEQVRRKAGKAMASGG
ncbi:MAG: 50S ribosomal protein L6 [Planctomycetaceae bacterium]|nr:MAG: 50S ribosomal protein L6 [Planctomycetaceae bacterium]